MFTFQRSSRRWDARWHVNLLTYDENVSRFAVSIIRQRGRAAWFDILIIITGNHRSCPSKHGRSIVGVDKAYIPLGVSSASEKEERKKEKEKERRKKNWKKIAIIIPPTRFRATWRNDRNSWLIASRGPDAPRGLPVPFSALHRASWIAKCTAPHRAVPHRAAPRRAAPRRVARKWDMSSEALFMRARMYGCWPAAEYNSGNTMELGQSCFDARLRSFHLLCSAVRKPPVVANTSVRASFRRHRATCPSIR